MNNTYAVLHNRNGKHKIPILELETLLDGKDAYFKCPIMNCSAIISRDYLYNKYFNHLENNSNIKVIEGFFDKDEKEFRCVNNHKYEYLDSTNMTNLSEYNIFPHSILICKKCNDNKKYCKNCLIKIDKNHFCL